MQSVLPTYVEGLGTVGNELEVWWLAGKEGLDDGSRYRGEKVVVITMVTVLLNLEVHHVEAIFQCDRCIFPETPICYT